MFRNYFVIYVFSLSFSLSLSLSQQNEAKMEELLREVKSLRDMVTLQDRRIAKLEEQVAKVGI